MIFRRRRRYRSASWYRGVRGLKHKNRNLWLGIMVSSVILLITVAIMLTALFSALRTRPFLIEVGDATNSDVPIIGSGLNLVHTPGLNLINNPSFEPYLSRRAHTVIGTGQMDTGQLLWMSSDEDTLDPDRQFEDEAYKLIRQGENGALQTVQSGVVKQQIQGVPNTSQIEGIIDAEYLNLDDSGVLDASVSHEADDSYFFGVGQFGYLVYIDSEGTKSMNISTARGFVTPLDGVTLTVPVAFTQVLRQGDYFYILNEHGYLFQSPVTDPFDLELVSHGTSNVAEPLRTYWRYLILIEDTIVAFSVTGEYIQYKDAVVSSGDLRLSLDASTIDSSPNGDKIEDLLLSMLYIEDIQMMGNYILMTNGQFVVMLSYQMRHSGAIVFRGVSGLQTTSDAFNQGSIWLKSIVIDEHTAIVRGTGNDFLKIEANFDRGQKPFKYTPYYSDESMDDRLANIAYDTVAIDEDHILYLMRDNRLVLKNLEMPDTALYELELDESIVPNLFLDHTDDSIYIASRTSQVYRLPFGSAAVIDEANTKAMNGDLILFEEEQPSISSDDLDQAYMWTVDEGVTSIKYAAGQHLNMPGDTSIKQIILEEDATGNLKERGLYSFSLKAKQVSSSNGQLLVEIEGPFQTIELSFDKINNTWKQFEESFIVPRHLNVNSPITVTITWIGSGDLQLDDLFLAPTVRDGNIYDVDFKEQITSMKAAILRFPDLGIGQAYGSLDAWQSYAEVNRYPSGLEDKVASLEAAMRLTQTSGAIPWLVIDSYATREQVKQVLHYLAAPVTEEMGAKRLSNGTAVPWSNQLSSILLEVVDNNDVYRTDSERAAFVDMVLDALESSPYYDQVKNNLVLIDGMTYKDGLMQSQADYHASSLSIKVTDSDSFLQMIDLTMETFTQARPRHLNRPGRSVPDLINSFSLAVYDGAIEARDLSAADYTHATLYGFLEGSATVMLDLDTRKQSTDLPLNVASMLQAYTADSLLDVRTLNPIEQTTELDQQRFYLRLERLRKKYELDENYSSSYVIDTYTYGVGSSANIKAVGFKQGDRQSVIVMNIGDTAGSFEMEFASSHSNTSMHYYEKTGKFSHTEDYPGDRRRIALAAGSVVIIDMELIE